MTHAILITAYLDARPVAEIVEFLGADFNFYVHFDRRRPVDISPLARYANVNLIRPQNCHYASYEHLEGILRLSATALLDSANTFFHLITGQDFPIKPPAHFLRALDTSQNYLSWHPVPAANWGSDGGQERLDYFYLLEYLDWKKYLCRKIIKKIMKFQRFFKLKRAAFAPALISRGGGLCGGSTYWSLTRAAVEYLVNYSAANPDYLARMRLTMCPEEIYPHTLLLNSPLRATIVNDSLRYIDWESGRGGYPAFLDETDFAKICASPALFARKFAPEFSLALKSQIIANLRARP